VGVVGDVDADEHEVLWPNQVSRCKPIGSVSPATFEVLRASWASAAVHGYGVLAGARGALGSGISWQLLRCVLLRMAVFLR
jgi:hypothetical protein